jgi:hypothetical protein
MDLPQVKISGYNHRANGVVERGHYTMREALVKVCEGNLDLWPQKLQEVIFADLITTSSVTGYSPYYLLYGQHPVLPFDITQATFMIDGYRDGLSTSELLALRVRQLQQRPEDIAHAAEMLRKHRFESKERFEEKFHHLIRTTDFSPGQLVLMHNTAIVNQMNRKTKPRYLGPFVVDRRTRKGSYVLRELDGTYLQYNVAAFRLAPYIARDKQTLAKLAKYNPEVTDALVEELLENHRSAEKIRASSEKKEKRFHKPKTNPSNFGKKFSNKRTRR